MIVDDQAKTRLSESVPDPLLGRTIDGYRIDEILGRGGMGVVYRATQLSLDRHVALKLLPEEVTDNRQFIDRFQREVDILARLSHPNIVTVFERGVVDGRPYIAMELVRGTALREVMRKGPLPPPEALVIVRSILSALEHAHDAGIIHRDIKPENVLVAPGGIVKVADFGLSRLLEDDLNTRLTNTHVALGTFEYMSPEQREMSRDADARSDLYATGVVLYEMIAGELPIGSFDALSRKRPRECDARIDEVVERSLKKSPDDRWQDAHSMADAVSRLLSAPAMQSSALPPPPPAPPLIDTVEEPTWKKVISNLIGAEYPVARIEKRLPRHFAQRLLEHVEVQRYLGRLVPLKPDFPGGVDFRTESGRLIMKFESRVRLDALQTKRLLAAYAVVLEANAPAGHCRRIAVADPQFEDANRATLANPPIVMREGGVRPDQIPEHSMLVSDAGLQSRHGGRGGRRHGFSAAGLFWSLFGLGAAAVFLWWFRSGASGGGVHVPLFGLGVAAAALVSMFLFRWSRNRAPAPGEAVEPRGKGVGFGLAITALWVTIVMVLSDGRWRDEEIAWPIVIAIASVFLLPRLPSLLKGMGAAIAVAIVVLMLMLLSGLWLSARESDGFDAVAASTEFATPMPWPADQRVVVLVRRGTTINPQAVTAALVDREVIAWVDHVVPGAGKYFTGTVVTEESGDLIAGGREGFWSLDGQTRINVAAALGALLETRYSKWFKRTAQPDEQTSKRILEAPAPREGEKFTKPVAHEATK